MKRPQYKCLWKALTLFMTICFDIHCKHKKNIINEAKYRNTVPNISRQRNRSTQIHISALCLYTQWVYTHRNTGTHFVCCFHSPPTCDWLQQSGVREAALYSLKSAMSWHLLFLFPFTRRQKCLLSISYADSHKPKPIVVYSHDGVWITSNSLT